MDMPEVNEPVWTPEPTPEATQCPVWTPSEGESPMPTEETTPEQVVPEENVPQVETPQATEDVQCSQPTTDASDLDNVPKTADESKLFLMLGIGAVAIVAIGGCYVYYRRKKSW